MVNFIESDHEDSASHYSYEPGQSSPGFVHTPSPLRTAAVRAHSPVRKYARMDLGYLSDVAEGDETEDLDELEAESQRYAPLETQVQDEHQDAIWDEVPECEDVGLLRGEAMMINSRLPRIGDKNETQPFLPVIQTSPPKLH
ncbi:hypothetical protein E8E13_010659 [Curvularia kusanoi]|uniref:Uncharacterized protein n=1 Tax=Curvularia kusanoi TaxID=90978 RepID=A0A9P4THL3_CURKU|nr:hypothetical protein E8E13_010659 [Curvularia kusanoi]